MRRHRPPVAPPSGLNSSSPILSARPSSLYRDRSSRPSRNPSGCIAAHQSKESIFFPLSRICGEMKFCKKYEEYMQGREKALPGVAIKKLKKTLKRCRSEFQPHQQIQSKLQTQSQLHGERNHPGQDGALSCNKCPDECPVCDGTFFPSLLKEMAAVVGCFNERAQKLLKMHMASGFRKCILWFGSELQWSDGALVEEGKELVTYAIINSIAMRKILKKYDKIHYSKQGQAFRSQAKSMRIEILQSPWLCELLSFYINLREEGKVNSRGAPGLFGDCSLTFDDGKPTLTCGLLDSVKLDINLTCSICLDTVFDPVSLTCGHIFCYMCCCSAASVTIVDGLHAANFKEKCPLCRQEGVYESAVHLDELNILLSHSCPEYWEERLQTERMERIRQTKEHWESQCRALMGL